MHYIIPNLYLGDYSDYLRVRRGRHLPQPENSESGGGDGAGVGLSSSSSSSTTSGNNSDSDEESSYYQGPAADVPPITHVLTMLPNTSTVHPPMSQLAFDIKDTSDADILSLLPQCIHFLDGALSRNQAVLVHCFAGVSRSATVVVAYIMTLANRLCSPATAPAARRLLGLDIPPQDRATRLHAVAINEELTAPLTVDEAIERVRKCRDFISPNDGFRDQLNLFQGMGYKVDTKSSLYKWHAVYTMSLSKKWRDAFTTHVARFGVDLPRHAPSGIACRACSHMLCLDEHVIGHPVSENLDMQHQWLSQLNGPDMEGSTFLEEIRTSVRDCRQIYVEPMRWMKPQLTRGIEPAHKLGTDESRSPDRFWVKLHCPGCDSHVGLFNIELSFNKCPGCDLLRSRGFILLPDRVDHRQADILSKLHVSVPQPS
ncbi:hypothetical protein CAOG_02362 [Capsaspora owczarzaki ATCC 30864]|uniref:protein-tyrosine-phosphatase n=1 Tax=Capsaspora owczarzaki (strain ATCC 30864) TaxID=595528 RepID=A0A0D2VM50_CAPO3|nr:hypothetical protein CAOG_02362 [Capsaspora owczarzaki ATCC 30864]KJE91197.1 hypothetical protein CAOG_002362 [Capsaspora owczarzaki ATCC 30864]|eukprot:XP_004349112.1 hypothetical protein CAOG_02362 [Capsaspora owczarzaki ATCC 30864]